MARLRGWLWKVVAGGSAFGVGAAAGALGQADGPPEPESIRLATDGETIDVEGQPVTVASPDIDLLDDSTSGLDTAGTDASADTQGSADTAGTSDTGGSADTNGSADTGGTDSPNSPETADSPDEDRDDSSGPGGGDDDSSGSGDGDDSSGSDG